MSGIPSDVAGSALQAGFQARDVAKVRDADRVGQAHATKNTSKTVDEAGSTAATTENDTAVFADAEGTGSKGRAYQDELLENQAEQQEADTDGVTTDADGNLHLDLEA